MNMFFPLFVMPFFDWCDLWKTQVYVFMMSYDVENTTTWIQLKPQMLTQSIKQHQDNIPVFCDPQEPAECFCHVVERNF